MYFDMASHVCKLLTDYYEVVLVLHLCFLFGKASVRISSSNQELFLKAPWPNIIAGTCPWVLSATPGLALAWLTWLPWLHWLLWLAWLARLARRGGLAWLVGLPGLLAWPDWLACLVG